MTKQEEIKEGIVYILKASWEVDRMQIHDNYDLDEEKATDKILQYLDSQGIVIKGESLGYSHPHLAAYFTVNPLIERR